MRSALALWTVLSLCAPAAFAVDPAPEPGAVPVPSGSVRLTRIAPSDPASPLQFLSYDNTVNATGLYYSTQNGREVIDDLHGTLGGALISFDFGYFEPTADSLAALITFYENAGGSDGVPVTVVAGPYLVSDLPGGAIAVTATVPGGPSVGPDMWMGVRFSTASTGLLIFDPPVEGTSHDYFYRRPGGFIYFGGSPVANFYMKVEVESVVPVELTSWGGIKRLYE